jgi:hypothetical protein
MERSRLKEDVIRNAGSRGPSRVKAEGAMKGLKGGSKGSKVN